MLVKSVASNIIINVSYKLNKYVQNDSINIFENVLKRLAYINTL